MVVIMVNGDLLPSRFTAASPGLHTQGFSSLLGIVLGLGTHIVLLSVGYWVFHFGTHWKFPGYWVLGIGYWASVHIIQVLIPMYKRENYPEPQAQCFAIFVLWTF